MDLIGAPRQQYQDRNRDTRHQDKPWISLRDRIAFGHVDPTMASNQRETAKAAMEIAITPSMTLIRDDYRHETKRCDRPKCQTCKNGIAAPTDEKANRNQRKEHQAL